MKYCYTCLFLLGLCLNAGANVPYLEEAGVVEGEVVVIEGAEYLKVAPGGFNFLITPEGEKFLLKEEGEYLKVAPGGFNFLIAPEGESREGENHDNYNGQYPIDENQTLNLAFRLQRTHSDRYKLFLLSCEMNYNGSYYVKECLPPSEKKQQLKEAKSQESVGD